MAQIRSMREHEAERVRDLWLQECVEAGTPLTEIAAHQVLVHLRQYATHQDVHCFVAEEHHRLVGFLTCCVIQHPIMPWRSGEIEELYVQPGSLREAIQAELVKQAVAFMQLRGARSIHTRIGIGEESPKEAQQRAFWQSLGWENDTTTYSIYSSVPGDPALQRVWDEYRAQAQTSTNLQHS